MTVFIEDCLIENFFVTLLLLLCTQKIFKTNQNCLKILAASVLGAIFACFYPLLEFNKFVKIVFKLLSGIFIVMVYDGKKNLGAKYFCFVLLTALYGGVNIMLYMAVYGTLNINNNFATHILILLLFGIYFIFSSCIKLMQKTFVISNFVYNVKIINQQKELNDTAFLDSGNTLIDKENNTPVFIINFKLFNKIFKNIKIQDILTKNYKQLKNPTYIKSGFASGSGKILIFTVDFVEITSKNCKKTIKDARLGLVYSAFNKNFNCNMLLNINAFV